MSTVIEGELVCLRHDDGRVEITQAPATIRMSLEFLASSDPVTVKVAGNQLAFGGQVVYRVTGWDNHAKALLAELVEDRRPG